MAKSTLQISSCIELDSMSDLGKVKGWLKELRLANGENDVLEQLREESAPVTPPRKPQTYQQVEKISPTDTSFSGNTIFDTPARGGCEPESPCATRRFRDDSSEVTSVDSADDERHWNIEEKVSETLPKPVFRPTRLCHKGFNSYEPTINSSKDEHEALPSVTAPRALRPRDPNSPRIVNILSCLQCTSAGLSCSRTTPSCTRCIRNKTPDTCLLLRHRYLHEINHTDDKNCTRPVLLKVKDEGESTWQNKLAVAEAMKEAWNEQQDRLNWVLPRVDSEVRGSWRAEGRVEGTRKWPSEGVGRVVFEELVVVEEGVVI
ncbi:hypothetical protein FB567DRAFT_443162 [Paraphoma chrysanthemicola]|uniref:Zn(2)-C6 fungal-type domain-containing protein n=1 Tax=Paraphoma chrysanthemicola TaxID=798071 RepID=A0A8K0VZ14_9PLEO|nr:hypothetical protein FB567DRAFT_443162 [Paraphoma chrysanthemicola]